MPWTRHFLGGCVCLALLGGALASCSSSQTNGPAGPNDDASSDASTDAGVVACVSGLSATCSSLYEPATFDTIFTKILQPNCATGTGTCHTSDARMGGLAFANEDEAYGLLVKGGRVVPNDPGCSLIMERVESADPNFHMPPGSFSILPSQACTIIHWIAAGALR